MSEQGFCVTHKQWQDLQAENAALRQELEAERAKVMAFVKAEPECPGPMPDALWAIISRDREACEQAFRITVQQTKKNILAAISQEPTK